MFGRFPGLRYSGVSGEENLAVRFADTIARAGEVHALRTQETGYGTPESGQRHEMQRQQEPSGPQDEENQRDTEQHRESGKEEDVFRRAHRARTVAP